MGLSQGPWLWVQPGRNRARPPAGPFPLRPCPLDTFQALGRPGGAGAGGSPGAPFQAVHPHGPGGHIGTPGMVNDIVAAIGPFHYGIVARAQDEAGYGAEYPRPFLVTGVGIRAQHPVRHPVVHPIGLILPASPAIEAVVPPAALAHAGALEGMPVEGASVHGPVGPEPLPIAAPP